jgi:hypothetical protein
MIPLFILDGFLDSFFEISVIYNQKYHFNLSFFGTSQKSYYALAEHMQKCFFRLLSIWVNNFTAHWVYSACAQPAFKFWQFLYGHPKTFWNAELISSLAEHKRKQFHRTLSLCRTNFCVFCSPSIKIWTVFTWTSKRMLSHRGNNFIVCWAY